MDDDLKTILERTCYRMEKIARNPRGDTGPKGVMEFHTKPESISPQHLAVLITTLTYAFSVSKTLSPEMPAKWPVHVTVSIDGVDACGAIAPAGIAPKPCEGN